MAGTFDSITPASPDVIGAASTRATYRELVGLGFESAEAANLVAYLAGLRVGVRPWTLAEINRMFFLQHLHRSRQVDSLGRRPELEAAA